MPHNAARPIRTRDAVIASLVLAMGGVPLIWSLMLALLRN
jgi:hypothetical protein